MSAEMGLALKTMTHKRRELLPLKAHAQPNRPNQWHIKTAGEEPSPTSECGLHLWN